MSDRPRCTLTRAACLTPATLVAADAALPMLRSMRPCPLLSDCPAAARLAAAYAELWFNEERGGKRNWQGPGGRQHFRPFPAASRLETCPAAVTWYCMYCSMTVPTSCCTWPGPEVPLGKLRPLARGGGRANRGTRGRKILRTGGGCVPRPHGWDVTRSSAGSDARRRRCRPQPRAGGSRRIPEHRSARPRRPCLGSGTTTSMTWCSCPRSRRTKSCARSRSASASPRSTPTSGRCCSA